MLAQREPRAARHELQVGAMVERRNQCLVSIAKKPLAMNDEVVRAMSPNLGHRTRVGKIGDGFSEPPVGGRKKAAVPVDQMLPMERRVVKIHWIVEQGCRELED